MTDVDSSDGVSSDFSYNDQNSIAGYSVTKNNTVISKADYTYNDTSGLLTGVTTDNGTYNSFSYTYDGLNRLSTLSHGVSGSSVSTNYVYTAGTNSDTTGLVGVIVYIKGGNAFMPTLGYTYDNNGNIATVSKNGTIHITYTYDSLNRLVREDNKDLNKTVTYTYDERGNILNKKTYAYTTGSLTNATVTDTVTYSYNSTWKDKLVSFDGQSISYDSIGNPTAYRGASLTWEKGRQLKSYATSSKTLNFKYNAEGLRTEKKVGSTTYSYTWSSGLLMQQSDGTNTLNFSYSPDGRPLAVKFNGTNYYYIYNLQGDVIGLYNTSGTVVVQYTYDSWGVLLSTTGSLASTLGKLNPFRYRGYIYDEETELYWLRSRYYDPETGRFLNIDGLIDNRGINTQNLFAYCGNNPVNRIDITGMSWNEVKAFFSLCWAGVKFWAANTFGAEYTTTATIKKEVSPIIPDPSPITLISGVTTTETVSQRGDSTKPVSVYADKNIQHPIISSTAGIKFNSENLSIKLNVGFENFGIYGSRSKDNTTKGFGLKINLSEFKFGFESFTSIFNEGTTVTSYTNSSINGWILAAVFVYVYTGQPFPVPKRVPAHTPA